MGLSKRPAGEGLAEPDLNPLVDVAFLLLLFFILATTFLKTAGSHMEVPAGKASPQQSKTLTVSLSSDLICWGEKARKVGMDELRQLLVNERLPEKKNASDRIVILDSKADVPYQRYFEVVMAINQAGGVLALMDNGKDGGDAQPPGKPHVAETAAGKP